MLELTSICGVMIFDVIIIFELSSCELVIHGTLTLHSTMMFELYASREVIRDVTVILLPT